MNVILSCFPYSRAIQLFKREDGTNQSPRIVLPELLQKLVDLKIKVRREGQRENNGGKKEDDQVRTKEVHISIVYTSAVNVCFL